MTAFLRQRVGLSCTNSLPDLKFTNGGAGLALSFGRSHDDGPRIGLSSVTGGVVDLPI